MTDTQANMADELRAFQTDLAACQEKIASINEEFDELKPEKEAALKASVEMGKRMKALSESARVPIARSQGLRSQIARLEAQMPEDYEPVENSEDYESPPDPADDSGPDSIVKA